MRHLLFFCILLAVPLQGSAFTNPFSDNVMLHDTEERTLRSSEGERYTLFISYPENYENDKTATYPVLYLLDADACFASVQSIVHNLARSGDVPKMLVIGIAYGVDDLGNWKRRRDFTPTVDLSYNEQTGGAGALKAFLRDDLIPYIDGHFRTIEGERTLAGYSYSGLFSVYSMLKEPELFRRCIAVSPSLWWDGNVIFLHEQLSGLRRLPEASYLYFSVGDRETFEDESPSMLDNAKDLASRISAGGYQNLRVKFSVLEEESHFSGFPIAFTKGLRFVFEEYGGGRVTPGH